MRKACTDAGLQQLSLWWNPWEQIQCHKPRVKTGKSGIQTCDHRILACQRDVTLFSELSALDIWVTRVTEILCPYLGVMKGFLLVIWGIWWLSHWVDPSGWTVSSLAYLPSASPSQRRSATQEEGGEGGQSIVLSHVFAQHIFSLRTFWIQFFLTFYEMWRHQQLVCQQALFHYHSINNMLRIKLQYKSYL